MSDARTSETASFTTLLCLGMAIVFRSATVREAVRTALFTGLLLLLCFVFQKLGEKGFSLPRILFCEFAAIILAVSIYEAFIQVVPTDRADGFSIIGEVLYAFLYIPLIADRFERRSKITLGRTVLLFLIFTVTILFLSAIRELGSVGAIWNTEVPSGLVGRTPYLAHDSSAALIVAALMIASRLFVRRRGGESLSFTGDRGGKVEVPYLDVRLEKEQFRIAVALLGVTVIIGTAVLMGAYGLRILGLPAFCLPPMAVAVQALVIGLAVSLFAKDPNGFAAVVRRPFLLPLQAAVVLLPLQFLFEKESGMSGLLIRGLGYLVSIILLWAFVLGLISFIRTFKRKMLFGRRPKSVEGLPFVFIIAAIGMIVLTEFAGMFGVTV